MSHNYYIGGKMIKIKVILKNKREIICQALTKNFALDLVIALIMSDYKVDSSEAELMVKNIVIL